MDGWQMISLGQAPVSRVSSKSSRGFFPPRHSPSQLLDHDAQTPRLMDPSTSPPSPSESESDYIKKFVWHSSYIAHVEPKILELCKDDFGILKQCYSAPMKDSDGVPISNSLFLPPAGANLEDYYWDVNETGSGPPPPPDHRELWVHVTGPGVNGLFGARTPWNCP